MKEHQIVLTDNELYVLFCILSGDSKTQTNKKIITSILERDFPIETELQDALKDARNVFDKLVTSLREKDE
jgi:hypothetical protein